jgi:hypothetical protein
VDLCENEENDSSKPEVHDKGLQTLSCTLVCTGKCIQQLITTVEKYCLLRNQEKCLINAFKIYLLMWETFKKDINTLFFR